MMRILVIGGFEAGSSKAHAINTVKMAQGFARLGHDLTIICRQPASGQISTQQLAEIYGLTATLRWITLPNRFFGLTLDKDWWFSFLALPIALKLRPELVFARHYIFPWLSTKAGFLTVVEKHTSVGHQSRPFRWLVGATKHAQFSAWVTISHHLVDYYHQQGVPKEKLLVLPDAVDLQLFQRPNRLPLSPYPQQPNVVYTGHLYDYKGIPTILEAAAQLPNIQFHLVGGLPQDIDRQQQRAQALNLQNVTFYGFKPQVEIPAFLWHADVLLLPPSQHHPSAKWTSPMKLAEYLASGTPVVATDISALRDWLSDREVEFVSPDDPEALAQGICRVLSDRPRTEQRQKAGREKAQQLSYEKRAESILKFCR